MSENITSGSVANHLNDLTKDHRELTINWIRDRLDRGGNHVAWIARHGLRALAKSGDREVLELLRSFD